MMAEQFYPFYVCTAVRRFFFFLDPKRTGRVKITALLESRELQALHHLCDEGWGSGKEEGEWSVFSPYSVQALYGQVGYRIHRTIDLLHVLCRSRVCCY
jgi:hypothetical protein